MTMLMATETESESKYYSVAVIGSSGGGTATLGHTDPIELLTTIHQELLRIGDAHVHDDKGKRRRVCIGISHAIFVSLTDGSGFDSIKKKDWMPDDGCGDGTGPTAALYSVGFHEHDAANADGLSTQQQYPFHVKLVDEGPITKINRLAQSLDVALSEAIRRCHPVSNNDTSNPHIAAIISISSEPVTIHSASLGDCNRLDGFDFPIAGSGGTSLSQIASLYDLRIVGNSGGSVASTSLTKARGWAMGLANEWDMTYDANRPPATVSEAPDQRSHSESPTDKQNDGFSKTTPIPTLKSILEAALPTFLFVCIALRMVDTWGKDAEDEVSCIWNNQNELHRHTPSSIVTYALRHIVIGTTCCILAATSRSSSFMFSVPNNPSGDQSTLLMSATIAGVIASASASQSAFPPSSTGGGGALAGLVAGACIPFVLAKVSNVCFRYHVTATMTNILCGGGVGMMVGALMHASGLAHLLGVLTGAIRSLLRWKMLPSPENSSDLTLAWLEEAIIRFLRYLQVLWSTTISRAPSILHGASILEAQNEQCSLQLLPLPMGMGFLHGCIFVYGSKIGWYHSLFLPAILLEMDSARADDGASLFGAIDECSLVMICAGICLGNLVLPPPRQQKNNYAGEKTKNGMSSLSWQALKTNIFCGDFIEAAYPSMERSMIINGSAYLAAGLSTEILLQRRVMSTAYMPLFVAVWISNDGWGMGIACLVAFVVSLCGTLAANFISTRKQ